MSRKPPTFARNRLHTCCWAVGLLGIAACVSNDEDFPDMQYMCETDPTPSQAAALDHNCGVGDPKLPTEPQFPSEVCQTLVAT
jgi:hypothetical protein